MRFIKYSYEGCNCKCLCNCICKQNEKVHKHSYLECKNENKKCESKECKCKYPILLHNFICNALILKDLEYLKEQMIKIYKCLYVGSAIGNSIILELLIHLIDLLKKL